MKTLDLTNLEKSDIKYKISKMPDGQQQVTITEFHKANETFKPPPGIQSVQIKSRFNNWLDLELITASVASLRELGVEEIHLYTPYFLGARSDRKFEKGGNNYLKQVICPIINSLGFKTVTVLDPHSHVLEACLNNYKKIDNVELIDFALLDLYKSTKGGFLNQVHDTTNCILVSPDAGASHKIYKLAEQIGYKGDIITCSKERDKDGNLTKTVVPLSMNMANKDYIIIDDICDGGRTFINIAKEVRNKPLKGSIYLIVTHGIFSAGLSELGKYFDGIYCTNSYQDLEPENDGNDYVYPYLVKQLNVF